MKILSIFFIGLGLFPAVAFAESLEPEEVVRTLVRAVHENDLAQFVATADLSRIENHRRHGRSPSVLLTLLRDIKVEQIKFQKVDRKGWHKSAAVRMTVSMNFDLELTKANNEEQEDRYRVVAVYP